MKKSISGFTIVELLIVIVVIAILATIITVTFNGISTRAKEASIKSDLSSNAKLLETKKIFDGSYASNQASAGLQISSGNTALYAKSPTAAIDGYCLSVSNGPIAYYIWSWSTGPRAGTCPGWFWVSKGGAGPGGTNYLTVSTMMFRSGSYRIRCLKDGVGLSPYSSYTLYSSGSAQLSCFADSTTIGSMQIEIEGIGVSKPTSW